MEIFNTELWSKHIFKSLLENMQDMPPEFSEAVDKHFWDLVQDTPKGDRIQATESSSDQPKGCQQGSLGASSNQGGLGQ